MHTNYNQVGQVKNVLKNQKTEENTKKDDGQVKSETTTTSAITNSEEVKERNKPKETIKSDRYVVTGCSLLILREKANKESDIVTLLRNGDEVKTLEEGTPWIKVRTVDNKEGFCMREYLKTK